MPDTHAQALRRAGQPLPEALIDPHPDRLDRTAPSAGSILSAHRAAVEEGADGFVDPVSGLFSFTAAYHWAKGACCELGCRHCPWVDADLRIGQAGSPPGQ